MQNVYGINSSFTVSSLLDLLMLRDILENLKKLMVVLDLVLGFDEWNIKFHYENGISNLHSHKISIIDKVYDIIQTLLANDIPIQFLNLQRSLSIELLKHYKMH